MNLSNMSVVDLRSLLEQIKNEIRRREHEDLTKAREQILAIAHSVGMPLKELLSANIRTGKTGTVAVRYRHPDNPALAWTGRGRQPKWVQAWVEGGKTMDALRV